MNKKLILSNFERHRSICIPLAHLKNIEKKLKQLSHFKVSPLRTMELGIAQVRDKGYWGMRLGRGWAAEWYDALEKLALEEAPVECICGEMWCVRSWGQRRREAYQSGVHYTFPSIQKGNAGAPMDWLNFLSGSEC